jgi:hypothetical protein
LVFVIGAPHSTATIRQFADVAHQAIRRQERVMPGIVCRPWASIKQDWPYGDQFDDNPDQYGP